ncbi:hypothetical protein EP7_004469 [Isosphaeraceae bacterium EP7]
MHRSDGDSPQAWKTWVILAWVVLIAGLYAGTLARSRPGLAAGVHRAFAQLPILRR